MSVLYGRCSRFEPNLEDLVRRRIDAALATGRLLSPGGIITEWKLRGSQRADVLEAELEHIERLIQG